MKQKKIAVLALLLLNALLASGLIFLLRPAESEQTAQTETAVVYAVTDYALTDVMALKIEHAEASYAMMQSGAQVEMISRTEGSYDLSQMRAVIYAACHISSSRKMTDPQSFSQYGAENPFATVTIFLTDGTQRILQVLLDNPLDESTYLYDEAESAVYLVSRSVTDLFLRSEKDYLSHTIFDLKTTNDFAGVEKIALSYPSGYSRDYTIEKTDQGYYLTAPISHRLSGDRVSSDLLSSLLQLYADEVVAAGVSPSDYGFDTPDLKVDLTMNGQTQTALFILGEDACLMASPQGDTVYSLSSDPVYMLMLDYTSLLSGSVVSYGAADIQDMTLRRGQESRFLSFGGNGAELSVSMDGRMLPSDQVSQLISAINTLAPAAELAGESTAEPVLSIEVRLRSGAKETVDLIDIGQSLYAVRINGVINFAAVSDAYAQLSDLIQTLFEQS